MWMLGGGERLLERARPGVLFEDLAACNAYGDGLASAARVTVPATVVLGERDLMTPAAPAASSRPRCPTRASSCSRAPATC